MGMTGSDKRNEQEVPAGAGPVTLEVLTPMGKTISRADLHPAPRLTDLRNRKICLMWNGKKHGDVLLKRLAEVLGNRFEDTEFVELPSGEGREWSEYPDEETIGAMAEKHNCEAVIGAIGD
jgi:hypothetical protein